MKTIDRGQAKLYHNICQFTSRGRFCVCWKIQWKRNEDDKIQNIKQSKEIEWTTIKRQYIQKAIEIKKNNKENWPVPVYGFG